MKTDVEELSPTRVRLSVEVPFDELGPSLDKAYREIAREIRVPGFRPGKAPRPVIDRRVGRDYVLSHAVNDAIPALYGKAVEEKEISALGTPEVELTQLNYGQELTFTAEVDVRPEFELPDLETITVQVDGAVVTPDEVEEYLASVRERFGSLKGVDRPVADGDYVSIDLSATAGGEPVEDAQASGLSYQVGSGSLLAGLDEAITGLGSGESKTFQTELAGGEHAGEQADVTVTVISVKERELPELDDEFAQLASEHDSIGEWRAATRAELERMKRVQQVSQAREKTVQAVLEAVDIPLPESVLENEAQRRKESIEVQLTRAGFSVQDYLNERELTAGQFDAELAEQAREAVKSSLIMDKFATAEGLNVSNEDLSRYVAQQAMQLGVPAEQLARELVRSGEINSAAAETLHSKAVAEMTERITVTGPDGDVIDVKGIVAAMSGPDDDEADDGADDTSEAADIADAAGDVAGDGE